MEGNFKDRTELVEGEVKCTVCKGIGGERYSYGVIVNPCPKCGGKGKVYWNEEMMGKLKTINIIKK